jgi:tetratricopeptide (TPR) repeat protein
MPRGYTTILSSIRKMSEEKFRDICWEVVKGLGFTAPKSFDAPGVQVAIQATIVRMSTDEMFRTKEPWLITFARTSNYLSRRSLDAILDAAASVGTENLLTIVWGKIDQKNREDYHALAKSGETRSILLADFLAVDLTCDYVPEFCSSVKKRYFSFRRLRQSIIEQSQAASWRSHFKSLTALPARIKPGQAESILEEADLFRALDRTNSFLLLGDPGAGKTTSLLMLAEKLAQSGGRTPILMPLNRYGGNLLHDLRQLLEIDSRSIEEVSSLLATGAFTILLDGLNEVQPLDLQYSLIDEINRLTNPQSVTARSQWIVSGRKYDYSISRRPLENLENHTWELQVLTPDLIYQFLIDGLGAEEGQEAYENLGPSVREICSNPLLLNMVLTVRSQTGKIPNGRGALYHQFIDLLFDWGVERNDVIAENLTKLGDLLPLDYHNIASQTLVGLADAMTTTAILWSDARDSIAYSLAPLTPMSQEAANLMIDTLTRQGVLREQHSWVSFFHHTFQEYFQAFKLCELPVSELIPEGGVEGAKREAVIFVAGLIDAPNTLIQRALQYDLDLAYQIERDAAKQIDPELQRAIAMGLWTDAISAGGGWVGQRRPKALMFADLAARLGQTPEQLARDLRQSLDEKQIAKELLSFYQQIGDLDAQQEVFNRLGFATSEGVPSDLLFDAALMASAQGEYVKAVALYTEVIAGSPWNSGAYNNRASAYGALGNLTQALEDYKKALALNPHDAVARSNYAISLDKAGQKEKAAKELRVAIQHDPNYGSAHGTLASWLESINLEEAVYHFEQAAKLESSSSSRQKHLQKAAELQEKLGRLEDAISSLRQLVELSPSSGLVNQWKRKIASLRLALDERNRRSSVREQLLDQVEVPLANLARELLRAAGLEFEQDTSQWILTSKGKSGLPAPLPVALLDVPRLTGKMVRDAIQSLPSRSQQAKHIVLLTTAQAFEHDARVQLFAFHPQFAIALITSIEAQDALLQGDRDCYELLAHSLTQAAYKSGTNPFTYTTPIRERVEFFGRASELSEVLSLIQRRQPFGLYGIHKIGKSSLLQQISHHLSRSSKDILPIRIELDASVKNLSELYRRILEKLQGEIEISTEGVIDTSYFRRAVLRSVQNRQRNRRDYRILLIIDEYSYLIPDRSGNGGIKDYIEALGVFKTLRQEGYLDLLPCGRSSGLSRITGWREGENPFIGILLEKFLGPLSEAETIDMVRALGAKAALHFEDEGLNEMYAITGGHPLMTRALGSQILGLSKGVNSVKASLVNTAAEAYLSSDGDRALLLALCEAQLDSDEQRILKLLAVHPGLTLQGIESENTDAVARRRLREVVNSLVDVTLLRRDSGGRLSHQYELLRRAIVQDIL